MEDAVERKHCLEEVVELREGQPTREVKRKTPHWQKRDLYDETIGMMHGVSGYHVRFLRASNYDPSMLPISFGVTSIE
jgi:lantibiotic modifying enzyme